MLDTISMAEQLSGEYRKVFEKADMYSMISDGASETTDEKMMDLYDILLEAQTENKPIQKIIGEDVETFCKEFFAEEKKEQIGIQIGKQIYYVMRAVLVFSVLDILFLEEGRNMMTVQSNVVPLICGILDGLILCIIFKYALKPVIFKNKKINPILLSFIIIVLFIIPIIGTVMLIGKASITVNSVSLMILSGIYVAGYLGVRSVWRYKKYGRITKMDRVEKELKKEFNAEVSDKSLVKMMSEGMVKRFERINKKRRKKGKEELTYAEFADKLYKESENSLIADKVCIVLFAVIELVPTVSIMLNDGTLEGIIFGSITGILNALLYYFLIYKSNRNNVRLTRYILQQCEEENITIQQYVERNKEPVLK